MCYFCVVYGQLMTVHCAPLNLSLNYLQLILFPMSSPHSQTHTCSLEDPLNEARIQSDQTFSITISCTQSNKKLCKNIIEINEPLDFHEQVSKIIKSIDRQEMLLKTPRGLSKDETAVDLTKTFSIKGKKGKLYDEICPVCLSEYDSSQAILFCRHKFCFQCIWQWSKTSTACPCCRNHFTKIKKLMNGKSEMIEVQKKQMVFNQDDYFVCYVCGSGDNEHVLLICDSCDFYCCHIYCDPSLNDTIPEGQWECRNCVAHVSQTRPLSGIQSGSTGSTSQTEEQENKPIAARTRSTRVSNTEAVTLQRLRRRR